MIKNSKILEEFEKDIIKNTPCDINLNLYIFEELLNFAKYLNKIDNKDWLEDIKIDCKYAKTINGS